MTNENSLREKVSSKVAKLVCYINAWHSNNSGKIRGFMKHPDPAFTSFDEQMEIVDKATDQILALLTTEVLACVPSTWVFDNQSSGMVNPRERVCQLIRARLKKLIGVTLEEFDKSVLLDFEKDFRSFSYESNVVKEQNILNMVEVDEDKIKNIIEQNGYWTFAHFTINNFDFNTLIKAISAPKNKVIRMKKEA